MMFGNIVQVDTSRYLINITTLELEVLSQTWVFATIAIQLVAIRLLPKWGEVMCLVAIVPNGCGLSWRIALAG